jgi:hypothetical protein
MLQSRWSQNLLTVISVIVLVLLCLWGWNNGLAAGRSKTILKDAKAIQEGFKYFYKDQNRYPTTGEFEDANIMQAYLSNFPPQSFPNELCPKTYDYYSATPQTYELRICLPKGVSGYPEGWSTLKP